MSKREPKRNVPPGKKSQTPAPTAPLDAEAVTWTPFFERLGLRIDGSRPRPSVRDVERAFDFWRTLPDRMRRKGWPGGASAAERLNRLGTWQRAAQDILTAEAERLGLDSSSIRESGEACYSLLGRQPRFADKTTPQSQVAYWPHCLGERLAGLSAQEKEAVRAGERVLGRLLARVRLEKQGGDDWITSSVAEQDFYASRSTLRAAVADGRLTDFRPASKKGTTSPLILSRTEVGRHFTQRKK